MHKSIVWCLLIAVSVSEGARILAIVPTPSYSHQVAFQLLWRELSLRGHEVTLLTTDPISDPSLTNLTEIDLHFAYDLWNNKHNITDLVNISQESTIRFMKLFIAALKDIVQQELKHPDVVKLIKNETGQHFDLVMAESFHPTFYAFAEMYDCPLIGLVSMEALAVMYHMVGNPAHPVLHPDVSLPFLTPLSFMERVVSTLYLSYIKLYVEFVSNPADWVVIKKTFGERFPSIPEIRKRMSLMFINVDPIFNVVRPLLPSIIQIGGGSHIKRSKPLPKDLKEFLDNGDEGVVYFSLGTNVKKGNVGEETVKVILDTFSELPYKVLWKTDFEGFANKSDNIRLEKWLPQQDVLRHPNVKVFITQGGWQSIEESIYSHTPMVGLPFFADQPMNMKKMAAKGIALHLDHKTMTKEDFKSTIVEVMTNPSYRNQIKKLARLAQDQPMTGLEKAVWWTEYVLRNDGAEHLQAPSMELPFYQYYLLDVIGFCLAVLGLAICVTVIIIRLLFKVGRHVSVSLKGKVKVL